MQIVQLSGGLGNQLFQYAFYLKLKRKCEGVYLDDITRYKDGKERNNQLPMTGVKYAPAEIDDILRLTDRDRHLKNWIRRRFTGSRDVIKQENDILSENGYWVGYWQSAGGYETIEDELRSNVFGADFHDEVTDAEIRKKIENTCSVGVHIRRGDYLNPDVVEMYGGICTDEYYDAAFSMMREKLPGCTFYVFSNDAEWVKKKYPEEDVVVMEGNDEEHGYRDMYLMSLCKHNIIANSSFSWWGAWLNRNPEKTVIGPSIWIHKEGFDKIYEGFKVTRITPDGEILAD